jgi:two-component system cell cycle response regulator
MSGKKMTSIKILLVEDSLTQALNLQHILEGNGFSVTTAQNGAEGLEKVHQSSPDIIVTDIMMPIMDGYELCSKIKGDPILRHIPVILLTTLSDVEDILKGLKCGADNFITKPYEESHLISRIEYILANQKLRQGVSSDIAIEVAFGGQRYLLTSARIQILDLLIASFETAVRKNRELEEANQKLRAAVQTIDTLRDLIPICCHCKKIRNDRGYWQQLEVYFEEHSLAEFTHGICPDCVQTHYPTTLQGGGHSTRGNPDALPADPNPKSSG